VPYCAAVVSRGRAVFVVFGADRSCDRSGCLAGTGSVAHLDPDDIAMPGCHRAELCCGSCQPDQRRG
ncbi:hypothetical protein ACOV11_25520, partial [Vibrio natriegens]